ncbi:MAG: bifunctional 3-deoxy-7-phosphoheptulonate synthase/chorismate mutase type II [Muribaculaceae bacterium]|nr:bifunctional 3-deoxy-7-phosphoheptulonate synthase/chorismate mutase type II [Muribaculaceae bacterium]
MKQLLPLGLPGTEKPGPIIIAGPCSAETLEQTMSTALDLSRNGIKIFRAGIWKPRTKPGGFEGIGEKGLCWLSEVKKATGMSTSTEVATKAHVEAAINAGIDMLWIGARTSANPFAMQEIADTIAKLNPDIPVLVKNPVNPDLELWIGALMRLYNAGVRRLGAIHRGFSTYGKHLYRNVPQWEVPFELARRYSNLPIICDPSHIGGKRELVGPLSQEALDMGFDGLIIESHCNPDCALSDKSQQVTPEVLNFILSTLVVRDQVQTTENLAMLRRQIDSLDNQLIDVLGRRMAVCREIGQYKKDHRMTIVQAGRYDSIMNSRVEAAKKIGMDGEFMRTVLAAIHEESVRQQLEILNRR